MTPVTAKMGRMSAPDIHKERLETLRTQAVERLRTRRAYRSPDCGYRSFRRDCPRCGEALRGCDSATPMCERIGAGPREFRTRPGEGCWPCGFVSGKIDFTGSHSGRTGGNGVK